MSIRVNHIDPELSWAIGWPIGKIIDIHKFRIEFDIGSMPVASLILAHKVFVNSFLQGVVVIHIEGGTLREKIISFIIGTAQQVPDDVAYFVRFPDPWVPSYASQSIYKPSDP